MYVEKFKEMFSKMAIEKNAALIPVYYHKELLLYVNGEEIGYQAFLDDHIELYKSDKQYKVEYDEDTLMAQGDKVACRMWITISTPNSLPNKMEIVVIAQYKDDKIYRLWELTYPDWSKLPEFQR